MVKKILAFLILTLALFNINAIPSFASYDKGLPYLVEPIFPENQDKHVNQYISYIPEIKFIKSRN